MVCSSSQWTYWFLPNACISSGQAYGGPIQAGDLIALLENTRAASDSNQPVELSFTGEGEAVMNVAACFGALLMVWTGRKQAQLEANR